MKSITVVASIGLLAATVFIIAVPTWEAVPARALQVGLPQSVQFFDDKEKLPINQAPVSIPPAATGGPMATEVYKNVKVLTDVSAAEFMRTQEAITRWVSPTQGCDFCHTGTDYASDAKPTKIAARVMLQMTRHINTDWTNHVAPSGVTCFSCHRGQPVPAEVWFQQPPGPDRKLIGKEFNWHEDADTVDKFFPDAGYAEYYLQNQPISVQSTDALPNGTVANSIVATRVYEMMIELASEVGANCGTCHNSRALEDWNQSSPYRWTSYYALHQLQEMNNTYLSQVAAAVPETRVLQHETNIPVLPAHESGIQLGNGLATCGTCHYGILKPLNGANMLKDYPALTTAAASAAH